MKVILVLFCILSAYEVFAQGDAPPFTQGQKQTTGDVATRIRVPNNQSTKLSSSQALIETGNRNLLANPGFEHQNFATSWTTTGSATISTEASAPLNGNKSFKAVMAANAVQIYQDSTLYAGVLAGTQGVIRFSASNTAPGATCYQRAAGVKLTGANNKVTLTTDGLKRSYEIPIVLSATSNGVECDTGTTVGTLILDDFEISDSLSVPEVSQSRLYGSITYAATNCSWSRGAAGDFAVDADCTASNIIGGASAPATRIPAITLLNAPPGEYRVFAKTQDSISTTGDCYYALNDSAVTTFANGYWFSNLNEKRTIDQMSQKFIYTSPGDREIRVQLAGISGSPTCVLPGGTTQPLIFDVYYTPPASKIYSQNGNTGWTDFTPTGSWVTNTTYIGKYRVNNGMAEIQYRWNTSGAPTATSLTLNLPNGWALDTNKLSTGTSYTALPTSQCILRDAAPAAFNCYAGYSSTTAFVVIINEAGGTYVTANGAVTQAVPMTWATGDYGSVTVVLPIVGITESQITGTFREVMTVPGVSKPKTWRATGNCSSSASLASQLGATATIGNISGGACVLTIPSNTFSASPICLAVFAGTLGASSSRSIGHLVSSATSVTVDCTQQGPADCTNYDFSIDCLQNSP